MAGLWWVWMSGGVVLGIIEVFDPGLLLPRLLGRGGVTGLVLLVGWPFAAWLAASLAYTLLLFFAVSRWLLGSSFGARWACGRASSRSGPRHQRGLSRSPEAPAAGPGLSRPARRRPVEVSLHPLMPRIVDHDRGQPAPVVGVIAQQHHRERHEQDCRHLRLHFVAEGGTGVAYATKVSGEIRAISWQVPENGRHSRPVHPQARHSAIGSQSGSLVRWPVRTVSRMGPM
jgi:hypothetical protein